MSKPYKLRHCVKYSLWNRATTIYFSIVILEIYTLLSHTSFYNDVVGIPSRREGAPRSNGPLVAGETDDGQRADRTVESHRSLRQ